MANEEKYSFLENEKIEIILKYMTPGTILKGNTYDFNGKFIKEANSPFTKEEIEGYLKAGYEKLYYVKEHTDEPPKRTEEPKVVQVTELEPKPAPKPEKAPKTEEIISRSTQLSAKEELINIFSSAKEDKKINSEKIKKIVEHMWDELRDSNTTGLNLLEYIDFDDFNYAHSVNVCMLSLIMSKYISLKDIETIELGIAGLLHDVGNAKIPKEILSKYNLQGQQRELYEKHTILGYNMLKSDLQVTDNVRKMVLLHHELYNGSGFPMKYSYGQIALLPHIITMAEYYEDLSTDYDDKKGWDPREIAEYVLVNSGKLFMPKIALILVKFIIDWNGYSDFFKAGDFALLNTNEIIRVAHVNPTIPFRPVVEIIRDTRGNFKRHPSDIDLTRDSSREIVKLIREEETIALIKKHAGIRK